MSDKNPYKPPSADLSPRSKGGGGQAMDLDYPLTVRFKIFALASQFSVTDSRGEMQMYVKQKAFKLKEDIRVFSDDSQSELLYQIKANKIIDFSAAYTVLAADGRDVGKRKIGVIRRKGMRSLFKATYEVCVNEDEGPIMIITEANPWTKFFDALLQQIPLVGIFSGYFLNPIYDLKTDDEARPVMQAKKLPAFLEGKFEIDKLKEVHPEDEELYLMGLVVMLLLERMRG